MESIENIKSVYQRIEDEARCELNKVQQQIYRISTPSKEVATPPKKAHTKRTAT